MSGIVREAAEAAAREAAEAAAREAAEKIAREAAEGVARESAEKITKEAGGKVGVKKLIESPLEKVWNFVKANPKLTGLGFTVVGASLYFGIQAAKGVEPEEAFNRLAAAGGEVAGTIAKGANIAAKEYMNASGIFGPFLDLWNNGKKYIIIACIIIILCAIFGVVMKFK